jgi:hypothetical protein
MAGFLLPSLSGDPVGWVHDKSLEISDIHAVYYIPSPPEASNFIVMLHKKKLHTGIYLTKETC